MPQGKKKIMIVDQDAFLSYILAVRFRRAGFNALSADSLDEAWGQLADFRPDVVIAAVDLGQDNGFDMLERVRQWEAESGRRAKVVLLDRLANPAKYNRSRAKGADGYIAKTSASFEDMLVIVREVLQGERAF